MLEPAEAAWPAPPWLGLSAAAVAGAGALANCALAAALHKSSTSGIFCILLQLAIVDIILGACISTDIWLFNSQKWPLGNKSCTIQRGLMVFASTASSYLIATLALHTLATANLDEKALARRIRRNNQDDDEEIKSSRHSLVAGSDSSTPPRTMNVDYRASTSKVRIIQPSLFVWGLALSVSVPDFTLATTVELDHGVVVCTIVDSSQRLQLYSILALFNLLLPSLIMCAAAILVIIKLKSKSVLLSQIEACESKSALKLSLWLIMAYFTLCLPRSILIAYNICTSMKSSETTLLEYIHHDKATASLGLVLSFISLTYLLVRPVLCIIFLPNARKVFIHGHRHRDDV